MASPVFWDDHLIDMHNIFTRNNLSKYDTSSCIYATFKYFNIFTKTGKILLKI